VSSEQPESRAVLEQGPQPGNVDGGPGHDRAITPQDGEQQRSARDTSKGHSYNIYMIGVGGQGIGLMGEVMMRVCLGAGYSVRGCDTHGLAQRGGIVQTHIRLGEGVHTPRISEGTADLVLALERLEALRGIVNMLKDGGTCIYYDTEYQPIHVRMGRAEYPSVDDVAAAAAVRNARIERVHLADLPDPRMQNIALFGRLASLHTIPGITGELIEQEIRNVVPAHALDQNLEVFRKAAAEPVEAAAG
jgi:indolepyruvate ferredoxin oxidoreductase beta subunit